MQTYNLFVCVHMHLCVHACLQHVCMDACVANCDNFSTYLFPGTPAVDRPLQHHSCPSCHCRQSPRLHYSRSPLSPQYCSDQQSNEQHHLCSWHQWLKIKIQFTAVKSLPIFSHLKWWIYEQFCIFTAIYIHSALLAISSFKFIAVNM